jgi:hypothetical protein
MEFSTNDVAWSKVTVTLLGRKITGLRGFEYKKSVEKEHVYASGDEPVDIQTGNKKYEGNIKVLKYEVDMMNEAALKAGFADILEVPHTLITLTCEFKKSATSRAEILAVPGLAFTELSFALEQNAKMNEVTLPFIAMRIQSLSKGAIT